MKRTQYRIKDLPKIERPRERLIAKGAQNLKDLPHSVPSLSGGDHYQGEEL